MCTFGTTNRGAIDNIPLIRKVLSEKKESLREGQLEFSIHLDAAIYGPLINAVTPYKDWGIPQIVNTISISMHKFLGAPTVFGIFLSNKDF